MSSVGWTNGRRCFKRTELSSSSGDDRKQGDLITMMSNRSYWQADETEQCMQMAPRTWYS